MNPDQNHFDLVVLDLNMPVTDGFEACTMIRSLYGNGSRSSRNLNIINLLKAQPYLVAVSGFIDDSTKVKVERAGFDQLFLMPLSLQDIQDLIVPRV